MFGRIFTAFLLAMVTVYVASFSGDGGAQVTVLQDVQDIGRDAAKLAEKVDKFLKGFSGLYGSPSGGSVYTRWGNDVCLEASELVYSGVTGGSLYSVSGGAANYLCLPSNPQFAPHQPAKTVSGTAFVYGTEYEIRPEPQNDHESLCAVCWSPRGATVMIPAANNCSTGWTLEYSGFLMAGRPDAGRVSSEYICVDSQLEDRHQPAPGNNNQAVLYFTKAKCGSLPCPPYREDKILGCVVCSK